ncbi:extracellular solute-binding protein [Lachnospiraceae bacterium ZAX-1]
MFRLKKVRMFQVKKMLSLFVICMLLVSLSACGGNAPSTPDATDSAEGTSGDAPEKGKDAPLTITYLTLGDQGTGLETWYRGLVDTFNTENEGKANLDVEWMQGNDIEYQSKLRMLNAADQLPNFFATGGDPSFYQVLRKSGRLLDLKPYIDADPEWKARLIPDAITAFTEEDGSIYMVPEAAMVPVGMYWNKELFKKAGLDHFPTTWDEFWETCDTLQAAGITPLALQTSGAAWTSMVLAISSMAGSQEGIDFMNIRFPDSYDVPVFRDMMDLYVRLFKYCNPDALGGDYSLAANHFTSEEAAMMLNGAWMMSTLSDTEYSNEGLEERVHFSPFPDNTVVYSLDQVGFVISADASQEQIEATVDYAKTLSLPKNLETYFELTGGYSENITLAQDQYDGLIPAMKDYADMFKDIKTIIPNYQTQWNAIILNEVFTTDLPALVQGSMTLDEYIAASDEAVVEYNEQNEESE